MKAAVKERSLGMSMVEIPKKTQKRWNTPGSKVFIWKRDYSIKGSNHDTGFWSFMEAM